MCFALAVICKLSSRCLTVLVVPEEVRMATASSYIKFGYTCMHVLQLKISLRLCMCSLKLLNLQHKIIFNVQKKIIGTKTVTAPSVVYM